MCFCVYVCFWIFVHVKLERQIHFCWAKKSLSDPARLRAIHGGIVYVTFMLLCKVLWYVPYAEPVSFFWQFPNPAFILHSDFYVAFLASMGKILKVGLRSLLIFVNQEEFWEDGFLGGMRQLLTFKEKIRCCTGRIQGIWNTEPLNFVPLLRSL